MSKNSTLLLIVAGVGVAALVLFRRKEPGQTNSRTFQGGGGANALPRLSLQSDPVAAALNATPGIINAFGNLFRRKATSADVYVGAVPQITAAIPTAPTSSAVLEQGFDFNGIIEGVEYVV